MVPLVDEADPIVELRDDPDARQYQALLKDGSVALKDYRRGKNRIAFTHTEVPPQYRKQGIAGRLTKFALDDAVSRDLAIMPYCSYTAR